MAGSSQKAEAALAAVFWLSVVGVVLAVVSAWALAHPADDRIGTVLERVGNRLASSADWLRGAAVEGHPDWEAASMVAADGDPDAGAILIQRYGCGACHIVPGIPRARGTVGPDLTGLRARAYIGGVLPNRPGDLANWLQSPPRYAPDTAMPDMGITEAEAEHMVAYLYTLERR